MRAPLLLLLLLLTGKPKQQEGDAEQSNVEGSAAAASPRAGNVDLILEDSKRLGRKLSKQDQAKDLDESFDR